MTHHIAGEVTDLIRELIRNACVNDGSVGSGGEHRSVATLTAYLDGVDCEIATFEPRPGRESLVARIPGSEAGAASLMLMGHTDVVPANPETWQRDPFAGELVDGVVWGRGAVDMLNLTSSMAVAFRHLAAEGFRPRGDLVYFAVADEEAGGTWGAEWIADDDPDAIAADYVLTELGGPRLSIAGGPPKLLTAVAEKGAFWGSITVRGRSGHGSAPLRTDNALVTAAEVVRRLAGHRRPPTFTPVWREFVGGLDLPDELTAALLDEEALEELLDDVPDDGLARFVHASTHTTVSPNVCHAGVKTNVIPDTARIDFDIRGLPGDTEESVRAMLVEGLGDLSARVELELERAEEASVSPRDTPLWDVLQRHADRLVPGAVNVPYLIPGSTDSRHLRKLGATCYGYGAYSDRIGFGEFMGMFHGDDERIDVESLRLSTELWLGVARDLLG